MLPLPKIRRLSHPHVPRGDGDRQSPQRPECSPPLPGTFTEPLRSEKTSVNTEMDPGLSQGTRLGGSWGGFHSRADRQGQMPPAPFI